MKRKIQIGLALFFILSIVNLFTACEKDKGPGMPLPVNDSISMGAGYANDVFYSLANGVISEVSRTNWDIAFGVEAQTSAILINEAAGVELKAYPTTEGWQWTDPVDITEYDSWSSLLNPDTTWSDGAFGMNASGEELNYGWGNYNPASHNVEGSALYIIRLRNQEYRKIFVEIKYSTQKKYSFKYANLDGTGDTSVDLDVSDSNANFVYYSLVDGTRLDREPDRATWDLLFTKYTDNNIFYNVTGVLMNSTVLAVEADGSDIEDVSWTGDDYSEDISTIGYDWKSYSPALGYYEVDPDRVFILKLEDGTEHAIHFTAFDFMDGKFVFTKLQKTNN